MRAELDGAALLQSPGIQHAGSRLAAVIRNTCAFPTVTCQIICCENRAADFKTRSSSAKVISRRSSCASGESRLELLIFRLSFLKM